MLWSLIWNWPKFWSYEKKNKIQIDKVFVVRGTEGILSKIAIFFEKFDIFDKILNFIEIKKTVSSFTRFNSSLKFDSDRIYKMKKYWPKHVRWIPWPQFVECLPLCPDEVRWSLAYTRPDITSRIDCRIFGLKGTV